MKKIGEIAFNRVPRAKLSREWWRAGKQKVAVTCKHCGESGIQSQAQMQKYHKNGFSCYACTKKNNDELRQAINALNLRKLAQK